MRSTSPPICYFYTGAAFFQQLLQGCTDTHCGEKGDNRLRNAVGQYGQSQRPQQQAEGLVDGDGVILAEEHIDAAQHQKGVGEAAQSGTDTVGYRALRRALKRLRLKALQHRPATRPVRIRGTKQITRLQPLP